MSSTDTIAAIATPAGRGGIGVVRISGPAARSCAMALLGEVPEPRRAEYRVFRDADGGAIDAGIVLFFPAPRSFTGEDVLELQGHGGPVVLDALLERLLVLGARLARPGEFSERAFLNDKIDLAQAEAIADLIDSASREAARSAMRSLAGEFSARVHALIEALTDLRVYVEAAIDFPDEEIDFLADETLRERFRTLTEALNEITESARQGCLMREGIRVVIAGRPNVGKSSLLNRLAQRESAIVSEIPGTTRDVLREYIAIDGLPLHVIDTAGLRDSADPVERIGIDRAWGEIAQADRILLVLDGTETASTKEISGEIPGEIPEEIGTILARPEITERLTVVHNKSDLSGEEPALYRGGDGLMHLRLSALTGAGFDLLRHHLKACMGYAGAEQGAFIARRRHLDALGRAAGFVRHGLQQLERRRAGELAAEDLRQAQHALAEITGEVSNEALLGRIFASFCIGK